MSAEPLPDKPLPAEPLGPGSLAWRRPVDVRLLLGAGRALLLQVAHPAVGAGVAQHSNFRADPWPRLNRTIESLMTTLYGGPRAVEEARQLRSRHRTIKGIDQYGNPYHALDPDAFWWVHATLFESTVELHRRFGVPLSDAEQRQLYGEWRQVGVLLGLRPDQMPADLPSFWSYFDKMVRECLVDNKSVRDVLYVMSVVDVPPPWWRLPGWVWRRMLGPLAVKVMWTATVGTLPPVLRDRLDLKWAARDERGLRLLRFAVRRGLPFVPARLRFHPLAYQARRAASRAYPSGRCR